MIARVVATRKRMIAALLFGVVCGAALPEARTAVTRALVGWNAGVWLYLALIAHMTVVADHGHIQRTAPSHAEGARVVLAVVVLAAIFSVAAVVIELSAVKGAAARTALPNVMLAVSTVASSWVLLPTLFTLNYASLYYLPDKTRGLAFPGDDASFEPDYSDFAYFSFTIAVASQTSDIVVTTRSMRRLVMAQSILSFLFNTTILALTINMAASLF